MGSRNVSDGYFIALVKITRMMADVARQRHGGSKPIAILWEVASGKKLQAFHGHTGEVMVSDAK